MLDGVNYDVIVVGAGSGGVAVAMSLSDAGKSVVLIADGFVGGQCAFVACMPSKSLLRSARARHEAETTVVHGATTEPLVLAAADFDWPAAVRRRDSVANQRDDSDEAHKIEQSGVELVRGRGTLDGPGVVRAGDLVFRGAHVVIGTGSVPVWPEIDGLDDVPTWTSEEALTASELPKRLAVLGAGPIGCELSQVYARFGSRVTLIDSADRPVSREDPAVSAAMVTVLQADGVQLRLEVEVDRAARRGDGVSLSLNDGTTVDCDRILVVTGRRPATDDLGLESVGLALGEGGEIVVDGRCRAGAGLWAVGDVTAVAPYTHTANHQARVISDEILGRPCHEVTPGALPRAVYTDPPLAAVGMTEREARDAGHHVVVSETDLRTVSRAGAEGEGPLGPKDASGGLLRLIADRDHKVLLGAAAVGPEADSWIAEATLAIRARVPLEVLADVVRAFPTFAEAYTFGYLDLLSQVSAS